MADPNLAILPFHDDDICKLHKKDLMQYALSLRARNRSLLLQHIEMKSTAEWLDCTREVVARQEAFIRQLLDNSGIAGSPHFTSVLTGIADGSFTSLNDVFGTD